VKYIMGSGVGLCLGTIPVFSLGMPRDTSLGVIVGQVLKCHTISISITPW
jgi:hypothetical protein